MHLNLDSLILKAQHSFLDELERSKRNKRKKAEVQCTVNMDFEVKEIIRLMSMQKAVKAIALGGSRAIGTADNNSDYDIYVYGKRRIKKNIRKQILSRFCNYMEIGNSYWETEDNCILNNGISIDIIYRITNNFIHNIAAVVEKGTSSNGYTTCMWHNLMTSKIIYDKNNCLENAKKRFSLPYPSHLKNNIIKRNMNLLTDSIVSYDNQIKKSIKRQDVVNIGNRISAFLGSYFDIIFALNELQNPGEKYNVEICIEKCKLLPNGFEENIKSLYYCMGNDIDNTGSIIEKMIYELKHIVK